MLHVCILQGTNVRPTSNAQSLTVHVAIKKISAKLIHSKFVNIFN